MTYAYRCVRAQMLPLFEQKTVRKQVGVRTIQKKKGLFSSAIVEIEEPIFEEVVERVPTGKHSERFIDMDDLAKRITEACNDLDASGYDVIKISEIVGGWYDFKYLANGTRGDNHCSGGGYSYGYGYSVTDGVVIIAQKR